MPNQSVETVGTIADKAKVVLAIAAVIAGMAGFYFFSDRPLVLRVLMVLAGIALGLVIAWFSEPGRRFIGFSRESYLETRRVVWPSRKETLQTALAVFAFALVMAIFLWVIDKGLEWILYDLILSLKS